MLDLQTLAADLVPLSREQRAFFYRLLPGLRAFLTSLWGGPREYASYTFDEVRRILGWQHRWVAKRLALEEMLARLVSEGFLCVTVGHPDGQSRYQRPLQSAERGR